MSQPVIMKSNKYGIILILDPDLPFEELLVHITDKFLESEKFFKNAKMALSFEGRALSNREECQILDTISQKTSIHVVCVIDNDKEREQDTKRRIEGCLDREAGDIGRFYRGTLRSGQILDCETSIIVIGDVNPGAKVISTGNIVVLGALKGTAYAGISGNESCFVVALDMNPVQIKIGNIIGRSEDKGLLASLRERRRSATEPQVATVSDGHILIEPITKHTLTNI